MTRREVPHSAADAWAEWAEDFGETSANPKRGSWAALRHCFYGGMFAASAMLCKGPPKDLDTVRTRYFALQDELEAWAKADETAASADIEPVTQEWIDEIWEWLCRQGDDPKLGHMLWEMLDEAEDGQRRLPELGFGPQLMLALAGLEAIAQCTFPRHDDPSGNESSVPLSTELRAIAAMTLHRVSKGDGIGADDEDSWRLPRA
jgi:hypothetical protein